MNEVTSKWLTSVLISKLDEVTSAYQRAMDDLQLAEEYSRKMGDRCSALEEERDTLKADIETLKDRLKEASDHCDRLILESASAARPMPTYARPVPTNGTSLPDTTPPTYTITIDNNASQPDRNAIATVSQPDCNQIASKLQPDPESAKEPTPEVRTLVNSLEPQTSDRKAEPAQKEKKNRAPKGLDTGKIKALSTANPPWPVKEIAAEMGCSQQTIYKIQKDLGMRS